MQLCGYNNCKLLQSKCKNHSGLVFMQQNVFVPQRIVPVTFELANICAPTITPQYIAGMKGLTKTQHENKECKTVDLYLGTFNILSNFNANTQKFETYGGKEVNLSLKYRGPKLINVVKEMMKECDVVVTQDNDMFFKILRELQKQNQDIAGIYFVNNNKKDAVAQLIYMLDLPKFADFKSKMEAMNKDPEFIKQFPYVTKLKDMAGKDRDLLFSQQKIESVYNFLAVSFQKFYPDEYESFESFCGEYGATYASYFETKSNYPYISQTGIGIYFNAKKVEFVNVEVIKDKITEINLKEFKIFETVNGKDFNCKFKKSDATFTISNTTLLEEETKGNYIVVETLESAYRKEYVVESKVTQGYINVIDNISGNSGIFKNHGSVFVSEEFILVKPELVQKIGMFMNVNQFGFRRQSATTDDLLTAASLPIPYNVNAEDEKKIENNDLSVITTIPKNVPEDILMVLRQILPNYVAPSTHVPQMVHLIMKNCAL